MIVERTAEANQQLTNILYHIAVVDHSPLNAGDVLARIESIEGYMSDHPGIGRENKAMGTYEFTMPKDRICIIYEIYQDTIYILSYFHTFRSHSIRRISMNNR